MLGKYGFRTADVAESMEFGKQACWKVGKSYSLCDGKYGNRQVGVPESREIVERVCGKVGKSSNQHNEK